MPTGSSSPVSSDVTVLHERVDDVPLIVGMAEQLQLATVIDRHVRTHGHHQGWSTGQLVVGWLAYLLSQADHRKSAVQAWAQTHPTMLTTLFGVAPRPVEFSDDRLGLVLRRLSDPAVWARIEHDLWSATVEVYRPELAAVRLDSSTSLGYHQMQSDGLMQRGHSKDHRPDLPQLKLMAAVAQPFGPLVATDVLPGHRADDPLYTPLIARVRSMLGADTTGFLYVGDSKMAALATRADLVAHGDTYLMPLPTKSEPADQWVAWIDAAVRGAVPLMPLDTASPPAAVGYEHVRERTAAVDGQSQTWSERVLILRSTALAERQQAHLDSRLTATRAALERLTPPPTRGRKQYRDEASLRAAIAALIARADVDGLLDVGIAPDSTAARWVVTAVAPVGEAIADRRARLGWRALVTTTPAATWPPTRLLALYHAGWSQERAFHIVKAAPLGLSPLFVWLEDQLRGLTHLLTLGLRLLTLVELKLRERWAAPAEPAAGLYPEQPRRVTHHPSGVRILRAFAQAELTLTRITQADQVIWHLTTLQPLHQRILSDLGLRHDLYQHLIPDG
jgi:transposase